MARTPYQTEDGESTFNSADTSERQLAGDVVPFPRIKLEPLDIADDMQKKIMRYGDRNTVTPIKRPEK